MPGSRPPRSRGRLRARVVASVSVLLLTSPFLSACAPDARTELPDGVGVAIQQNRDDYGPRRLEVLVTNGTDSDFTVTAAEFSSSAFLGDADYEREVEIPVGSTRALRVDLAEADCASDGPFDAGVRLAYRDADGEGTGTITPEDPLGTLERVHGQDCLAERAAQHVAVTAADAVRVTTDAQGGAVAQLDLLFSPTDAPGSITVESVGRTILLRPASGSQEWPVGLEFGAGSAPSTVTLDIVPNNCNTHTVSEDKRGTFFPVQVTTSEGASGVFFVPVTDAVRGELYAFIANDVCHWG